MRKLVLLCCLLAAMGSALAVEVTPEVLSGEESPFVIAESRVSPEYPPAAKAARFEGSVILAAVIHEDGTVGEIEVVDSTRPNLGFEQAAIDAVRQWQFEPAVQNGEAVTSVAAYRLSFLLPRPGTRGNPYVSGGLLTSALVSPGLASRATPANPSAQSADAGGFSPANHVRHTVQTIKKPHELRSWGGMYDRRDWFPAPVDRGHFQPKDR